MSSPPPPPPIGKEEESDGGRGDVQMDLSFSQFSFLLLLTRLSH